MTDKQIEWLPKIFREKKGFYVLLSPTDQLLKEIKYQLSKELKESIQVSTAKGEDLDELARIFSLFRKPNEDDENFRARILSFWPGLNGSGTVDDIKQTIERVLQIDSSQIYITNISENLFEISFNYNNTINITDLKNVLYAARAVGNYYVLFVNFIIEPESTIVQTKDNVSFEVINFFIDSINKDGTIITG